jgi:NAD+ synthase
MSDAEAVVGTDVPLDLTLSASELDARREHIIRFLRGTVDDAGAAGAVLGLSGGIDSTLTAHLAVEALGTDGLHGLVMPSEVNDDANMSDAERVADDLDISYDVIGIEPVVESFREAFPADLDDAESDAATTAVGNVRVRTRAIFNYFAANLEDRIVLGTGNRSEALAGYFTKYGDQAVDCNPIGNLYKVQVRQLARHVGVPDDLVAKTPTAGMWVGQTDEEEMGLSYDVLDAVLALHIDGPLTKAATVRELAIDEAVVERVEDLVARSEHKRHMPPAPNSLD